MNIKYNRAIKSICPSDGKHILLWDFDSIALKKVLSSLTDIMNKYCLSHIYIIRSSNGFNAFCLDKHSLDFVYEIKNNTRYDDYWHQVNGYDLGGWCLRIDSDKTFEIMIPSLFYNIGSFSHKEFFRMMFHIDMEGIYDNSKLLCINYYIKKGVIKAHGKNTK